MNKENRAEIRRTLGAALLALLLGSGRLVFAAPFLTDTSVGTLKLVVKDTINLVEPEGLAFDPFGNLFVTLEITGSLGGVSYVDKNTGAVTNLVTGISRADGIILLPDGDFLVVSEVTPSSSIDRLYRVEVTYGTNNIPASASITSLTTKLSINNPEGTAADDGAFGVPGTIFVSEDANPGRIIRVNPNTGDATIFVDSSAMLNRPEGLAFGDFNGAALAPALYTPESGANRIRKIESNGATSVFGDPTAVGLKFPDGLKFGPDGFLYVAEDTEVGSDLGRVIRIAPDGTHTVFAGGFTDPSALAFDPTNGDLYIADQGTKSIWRVEFAQSNRAPTANIGGPYSGGTEDIAIIFNAAGSLDPDDDPLTYTWNFGDGTTVSTTEPTIAHTYLWGGIFTVTLTVSDGKGGTGMEATSVQVSEINDIPVANPGGPYSGTVRKAVTFDGSKSFDLDNRDGTTSNDQTLTYKWNFGDGTTAFTTNVLTTHTYKAEGTYTVTLVVFDGGANSVPAATTATIKKAAGKPRNATAPN